MIGAAHLLIWYHLMMCSSVLILDPSAFTLPSSLCWPMVMCFLVLTYSHSHFTFPLCSMTFVFATTPVNSRTLSSFRVMRCNRFCIPWRALLSTEHLSLAPSKTVEQAGKSTTKLRGANKQSKREEWTHWCWCCQPLSRYHQACPVFYI